MNVLGAYWQREMKTVWLTVAAMGWNDCTYLARPLYPQIGKGAILLRVSLIFEILAALSQIRGPWLFWVQMNVISEAESAFS